MSTAGANSATAATVSAMRQAARAAMPPPLDQPSAYTRQRSTQAARSIAAMVRASFGRSDGSQNPPAVAVG